MNMLIPDKYIGNLDHRLCALQWIIFAWLFAIFHWAGNTTDVAAYGSSIFLWMIDRWRDATVSVGEYSHGWLIPLVSLYALWRSRDKLLEAPKSVYWPALAVTVLALALHWIGARAQQPRISLLGFIIALWGIPCLLHGRAVARILLFPCFYLIFCIPMNFFDTFSFQLRILATYVTAGLLNGVGIPVLSSGSSIYAADHSFALEVADPCSGVRSLLALTALTTAFAYFAGLRFWKQVLMVAAAIPIAVAGNIVRVISIATVARFAGQEAATGFYHDYSGYVVFVVAVLLLLALERWLVAPCERATASEKPSI